MLHLNVFSASPSLYYSIHRTGYEVSLKEHPRISGRWGNKSGDTKVIIFISIVWLFDEDIKCSLRTGTACHCSVQTHLSSRLLSKNLKIKIYKAILCVLRCDSEMWSLTPKKEHRLKVFENNILRELFGPKSNEKREWRLAQIKLHSFKIKIIACTRIRTPVLQLRILVQARILLLKLTTKDLPYGYFENQIFIS